MKRIKHLVNAAVFSAITTCATMSVAEPVIQQPANTPIESIKEYPAFNVKVVGQGRPVILIPGVSSSAAVWDDTVTAFADDYQLHVVHMAGFAGLPAPKAEHVGASLLGFQKQAIQDYINDEQLSDVVIVGHSLGGFLSLWLATENADNVAAVVNVDGLPALGVLFGNQRSKTQGQPRPKAFDPIAMAKSMANNPEWHERIVTSMQTSDPMISGRAMGELMRLDIREQLANIKIPTLTLAAPAQALPYASYEQSQQNYHNQMKHMNADMYHIEFAQTAKHFIMADEPEWMNQKIQTFIANL